MNSKLLLALLLGFSVNIQAQVNQAVKKLHVGEAGGRMLTEPNPQKLRPSQGHLRIQPEKQPAASPLLTFVDTLYSFDFSTLDNVVLTPDSGENGSWVTGTHEQIGIGYFRLIDSLARFQSTSAANGYAMFDSDGLGEGSANDASLTIGPFSIPELQNDSNDITLNFEQWYLRFRDTASVWISTNGIDFTKVGDNLSIGVNTLQPNPRLQYFRITDYAGEDTVYIRFHYKGAWDYSWLIDDITVTETVMSGVDLLPVRLLCGDYIHHWNYAQIPLLQADSIGFSLIVQNQGYNTGSYGISYEIIKNNATVHTGSIDALKTLEAGKRDTIGHVTGYVPSDTGSYVIRVSIDAAAGDDEPDNNSASVVQQITSSSYSPVPENLSGLSISLNTEGTAPYRYYYVGQFFAMKQNQWITSIQAAITRPENFSGSHDFELAIYEVDAETLQPKEDPISEAIASFRMDESHPFGWKDFAFDRPVLLEGGRMYLASINSYGSDNSFWFASYADGDLDRGTLYYSVRTNQTAYSWFVINFTNFEYTRVSPAIRLNLDPTAIGINDTQTDIEFDAYPVPASNQLNVRMKLTTPSAFELRLTDMNGRVVFYKKNSSKISLYTESISLEQIVDGFYTLQVISSEGITTRKVVIAR